jgi:hypothetical protein
MACHQAELDAVIRRPDILRRHTGRPTPGSLKDDILEEYADELIKRDATLRDRKPQPKPGPLDSIFHSDAMPVAWFSLNSLPFQVGGAGNRFTPPTGYEYMLTGYLRGNLPAIGVKQSHIDEYRIAWCENVMNEIANSAVCMIDDYLTVQSFDHHWLNIEPEHYMPSGFDAEYKRGQGNESELQEYSTALPNYPIRANQPFFFSKASATAFPLFLMNSQSVFSITYDFLLSIGSLLRMTKLEGDRWVNIKPNLDALIGVPSDGMLKAPSLFGEFGKIRDNERKWNTCERDEYVYYTDDVVSCDFDNDEVCGKSVPVKLVDTAPTKCFFWAAHNVTAQEEYNIRSWYGILATGETPISTSSLFFGKEKKFGPLTNDHFFSLLRPHFIRAPRRPWFLCANFCHNSGSNNIDVAISLKDMTADLKVDLKDPELLKWRSNNMDVRGPQPSAKACTERFKIIGRLLVQHELYIDKLGHLTFRD